MSLHSGIWLETHCCHFAGIQKIKKSCFSKTVSVKRSSSKTIPTFKGVPIILEKVSFPIMKHLLNDSLKLNDDLESININVGITLSLIE